MFVWLNPRLFKRIISCHYINSEIRKWFRSFVTQTGTGARLCGIGVQCGLPQFWSSCGKCGFQQSGKISGRNDCTAKGWLPTPWLDRNGRQDVLSLGAPLGRAYNADLDLTRGRDRPG